MIDFDNTIFNIDIPGGKPDIGALLISEPFLREDYFHHSVICIADYAPDSTAMGIVLNRLTGYTLQNIIEGVKIEKPVSVYCGGPMANDRLFFLHTLGEVIQVAVKSRTIFLSEAISKPSGSMSISVTRWRVICVFSSDIAVGRAFNSTKRSAIGCGR